MIGTGRARLSGATAQAATGVVAHALAAGCLPAARGLVLALPSAVLAALVVERLLPDRPLLRLAAAQAAVHGVLLLAACAGAHVAHGSSPLLLAAHLAALVAGRGLLERAVDRALARASRVVRPRVPRLPALPALARPAAPAPTPLRARDLLTAAPHRGPPRPVLLPA